MITNTYEINGMNKSYEKFKDSNFNNAMLKSYYPTNFIKSSNKNGIKSQEWKICDSKVITERRPEGMIVKITAKDLGKIVEARKDIITNLIFYKTNLWLHINKGAINGN